MTSHPVLCLLHTTLSSHVYVWFPFSFDVATERIFLRTHADEYEQFIQLICETVIRLNLVKWCSVVLLACFFKCCCEELDAQWPVVRKEPVVPKIAERAATWVTPLRKSKGLLTFLVFGRTDCSWLSPKAFVCSASDYLQPDPETSRHFYARQTRFWK